MVHRVIIMNDPYKWDNKVIPSKGDLKLDPGCNCKECNPVNDVINHPHHYKYGPLETIEVIKGSMPSEQYKGYLKGNIIKYICRAEYKNGKEDIAKAVKYIEWLLECLK